MTAKNSADDERRVGGRSIHALAEYRGALGPLELTVDTGKATLHALVQKSWSQPMAE